MIARRAGQCYYKAILDSSTLFNDLDDGTDYTFNKFAKYRKLGGITNTLDGCPAIQKDLDRLGN